ncbi:thiamine phosphate synthase [Heliobacterium undosum]|uniref:Thiamine-phosphate synthase n=1 Tax=Heliomicrobium undosum TaxID=121734 RepID=A0A845L6W3_9FIRM|nr:thiamine phosphate synthase [Heliomicrobium undosum]MZP31436.1 thiamine phosphate synthase [Heliomicrobium undosum]
MSLDGLWTGRSALNMGRYGLFRRSLRGAAPLAWPPVLVTHRRLCPSDKGLLDVIAGAIEGGIGAVILREKDLTGKELLDLAQRALALTRPAGASLIVNGNPAVAVAAGADGVHLGAEDLPPAKVRSIIGPGMLLGRSIHSPEEAQALAESGEAAVLDYFLFGNVFETACKPGKAAAGLDALSESVRRSPVPVIAIGGITADKAPLIGQSGAAGVAIMSAIMTAADPVAAARAITVSVAKAAAGVVAGAVASVAESGDDSGILYGIIGREQAPDEATLAAMADGAYAGGCDIIQLREKNMPTGEFLRRAQILRERASRWGKLFIVNDRIDIALAAGADGVHLGAEDLPPEVARQMWPKGIIGVTVRNLAQAQAAVAAGADYVGAGPVYPTTSKKLDAQPLGFAGLQAICDAIDIPVVAIGGLNAGRMDGIGKTGCRGVAVISALFQSSDATGHPDRGQDHAAPCRLTAPQAHEMSDRPDAREASVRSVVEEAARRLKALL